MIQDRVAENCIGFCEFSFRALPYNNNRSVGYSFDLSLHRASLLLQRADLQSKQTVPGFLVVTLKMSLHRASL